MSKPQPAWLIYVARDGIQIHWIYVIDIRLKKKFPITQTQITELIEYHWGERDLVTHNK